ncbi:MAG: ABC transporter ATP-binding protein [Ruminiclostridium sp.]|nr:ABC transporter ATP-binding protein [Ruminiclostridium sp.]
MNLKLSLPKGVNEQDVIFSLPFDIDRKAKKVEGHLTATKEKLSVYYNGELSEEFFIDTFSEIEVQQLIGCSMLCVKDTLGNMKFVCAFSQKQFMRFAELAKIIEHYLRTGVFTETTDADEPACAKCGISLNGSKKCIYCEGDKGVFTKLVKRLAPYKRLFFLSLLSTFILYAFDVIGPIFQRVLVDELIVPNNSDWALFFKVSACILAMNLSSVGFRLLQDSSNYKISTAYGRDLRRDIFNKTQQLSMSNVSKRTAGELISRVSGDAATVQDFMTRQGKDMIFQTVSLIALIIVMFITNWKLALIVVIPLPFAAYLSVKSFNAISIRYGRVWRCQCRASELLHDVLHGVRVVKNYGGEEREIEAYRRASRKWADAVTRADILWYMVQPPIRYIFTIGEFCALFFGGSMILGKQMQLGELIQFTTYIYMLYGPVQWLTSLPRVLAQAKVSAGKVFEILEEQNDIRDTEEAKDIEIKGDIDFENVYFGYKAYNPVLKDISFSIKQGEMIGVVGHSGVGKSTLINLIMRLYDPTAGTVRIDGMDIRDISQNSLRSQVGVVLQETFLFTGTVIENIRYAKPDATFEEIITAAKIANCHNFITRMPDGYNTIVGERGYSISGGERQRIAIARAILHNPKILILDEATASLDTETEKQIQDALDRLIAGRTTIAIAHRLSTLANADRLIVLDKGKVAEVGSHNELLKNKGVYYRLVMAQRQTAKLKK